jgi:hypothetical protein
MGFFGKKMQGKTPLFSRKILPPGQPFFKNRKTQENWARNLPIDLSFSSQGVFVELSLEPAQ